MSHLVHKLIHRWKISQEWKTSNWTKNPNENTLNIWLWDVPGIETIIEIFQTGRIPTGISESGYCIQMNIRVRTHTFISSSFKYNRGLGGISWVEYFIRSVLFWSATVKRLQSFYFKENTLHFFHSYYLPQGFCELSFLPISTPICMAKRWKDRKRTPHKRACFCSFLRGPCLTQRLGLHCNSCLKDNDLHTSQSAKDLKQI